jgi:CubicO group peptidase (beta-lactamase class C family)
VVVPGGPDSTLDLDQVEQLVDLFAADGGPPGLAYGIVQDGRLVHSGGRGVCWADGPTPDAGTVFRIASMTKSFTAAAVLLLRDQGRLRLDDEVVLHVPEAAGLRPPTDDAPPLTLRSLLTMTAGLPTDDPWGDRQQDLPADGFAELLRGGLSFAWTPGTAYEYSNLGYALLGRAITAAAGVPYRELVTSRLLGPLGMASTGFAAEQFPARRLAVGHRPDAAGWQPVPFAGYGAFAPMGGLFSSVQDLARWVAGYTDAYPPRDGPNGDHPLSRATRREQQQPHRTVQAGLAWQSMAAHPVVRAVAYGFGLLVELDPALGELVSHSGGYPGFGSHMRWHPSSGLGVIVLGNATYVPASRLAARILDQVLLPRRIRPPGRPGTSAAASEAMVTATLAAASDVNRLIAGWDDALAERLLADNVDQDEPLRQRRRQVEELSSSLGPLVTDRSAGLTSLSPAHLAWWLRGPGGRVRVEIRMTPHRPPRVQTLRLTGVPHPPKRLRRLAERIAASLAGDVPPWPSALHPAPELDLARMHRELRAAAAWAGGCTVTEVLASDGTGEATFRLTGQRARLRLTLALPADSRRLTWFSLVPESPFPSI